MSDAISEKNLARYEAPYYGRGGTPFCLAQVKAYETDDPATQRKIDDLLEGRITNQTKTTIEQACNLGGCTLKITESSETGRTVTGQCKAASYCLKIAFEAVGQAPTVDEGRELYKEIINTLEGHAGKYSAGNFCPRLNCGLSAGVSIDQVPGTAGDCITEGLSTQQTLDFGPVV